MKKIIIAHICLLFSVAIFAQNPLQTNIDNEKMQWFQNARLGIFIHWGISSVDGMDLSWPIFNGKISETDYLKQLKGFNAKKYDPAAWANLFQDAGAKYVILTSKHHDGVALWDTKQKHYNTPQNTPSKKDVIAPLAKAIRNNDLKFGLYYSLIDLTHPDYDNFKRNEKRYNINESPERWNKFTNFYQSQVKEITTKYSPDILWFDGEWEHKAEDWKVSEIYNYIKTTSPKTIVNSRLTGMGDYATPENQVPITRPKAKYWELCMTMNDTWGYDPKDTNYKSAHDIINILVDCISMNGNLLLNVSPKADGTIPEKQAEILKSIGRWTKKHHEAIYTTIEGIPNGHFTGSTALSADKQTLYLFVDGKPTGPLLIKGLKNKIYRARIVGDGTILEHKEMGKMYWSSIPGLVYIDVPEDRLDSDVTVIAILLDGPVQLFREDVKAVESNL